VRRILIADDEHNIRHILDFSLNVEGFDVISAQDGEEALQLAASEAPDLIIMDVMMPGCGGVEACRRLKADTRTRSIPVILLTARSSREGPRGGRSGRRRGIRHQALQPPEGHRPGAVHPRCGPGVASGGNSELEWNVDTGTGSRRSLAVAAGAARRADGRTRPAALPCRPRDANDHREGNDDGGWTEGGRAGSAVRAAPRSGASRAAAADVHLPAPAGRGAVVARCGSRRPGRGRLRASKARGGPGGAGRRARTAAGAGRAGGRFGAGDPAARHHPRAAGRVPPRGRAAAPRRLAGHLLRLAAGRGRAAVPPAPRRARPCARDAVRRRRATRPSTAP
jgi:CheY-like chemotaxis protein